MSTGEFQLISRYFLSCEASRVGPEGIDKSGGPRLEIGIGDDAAVLSDIGTHRLAVSMDTLVESVHFPCHANPELLAQRSLRVNLSDMAAMGAQPRWFTLALTLPKVDERWLRGFSRGLHAVAAAFDCQLIGGDTVQGPLNIGIQIMGTIPDKGAVLRRSGAKSGDLLVVSGTLGDAGAALNLNLKSFDLNQEGFGGPSFLLSRYWLPSPRIDFALEASSYIHAACDVSDGLLADAGHLCEQSHLSAVIDLDKIPVSPELLDFDASARVNALTAGDDYELCMAVPQEHLKHLEKIAGTQNTRVTAVGVFESSSKHEGHRIRTLDHQGNQLDIKTTGYRHF